MNSSPKSKLAKLALDHIDTVNMSDRADILTAAADLVEDRELAKMCKATGAALRAADVHQLKLVQLLREASNS